ncbi:hypothetical protein D3C80_1429340 [compost metagenome]
MFLFPKLAVLHDEDGAIERVQLVAIEVLGDFEQLRFNRVSLDDNGVDLRPAEQRCGSGAVAACHQRVRRSLLRGRLADHDRADLPVFGHRSGNGLGIIHVDRAQALANMDARYGCTNELSHGRRPVRPLPHRAFP